MKKIGIISLFGYYNYGNRLQLYAVQKVYQHLGFDSEIIRYNLPKSKEPFLIRIKILVYYCFSFKINILKFYYKKLRIYNFKKHAKLHYKESEKYINPLKIDNSFHQDYSFFSVGSDQIWGWFVHKIANFVFLKFAPIEKRITFSPSFGSSIINHKYETIFKEGLQRFNFISVREESGFQIVKKMIHKEATILCDPTMCLSKEEWLSFAKTHKKKPSKKYILTYFLGEKSDKVKEILFKFSKDYEIVELNSFENSSFFTINPSEWVDYVKDASLVLTDSFHAVVFSLILHTPFSVFKRKGGESMQTRISHILEKFKMQECFEMNCENPRIFDFDIENVDEIIEKEKLKAFDFLKNTINSK